MKTNLSINIIDYLTATSQLIKRNHKLKIIPGWSSVVHSDEFNIKIKHLDKGFMFLYCKKRFLTKNTLIDACYNTGNGVTRWVDEVKLTDLNSIIKHL